MSKVNIREAVEDDALDCLMLFKSFHKESKQPFKFDTARTLETFQTAVSGGSAIKFFVAELNGEIVGFVTAIVYQHLFSKDKTADELAWYVDKDHRGGSAALRLLKAYEEWAVGQGVRCVTMSHIEDLADLSKMYNKLGYKKIEATFQKEI